ncbi:unnamed protein product [Somion occarium]|uniref:Peroxidase n=1 Tax=Somion occarium TaxID=3059160 RepID=A0ABP1E693_9APHY
MPQESLILKKNSVRISLAFAPQGFNQEDMLGLIACGHSFGSVQNTAFPDIIPPSTDPHDTSGNVHFDSTFDHFDNKIVTEYLSGTTGNLLSDHNVTINKFADPDVVASTCASLFARMIDTVHKGVQLTEVLEPLPVKPHQVTLTLLDDGTILLQGDVRLWDKQDDPDRSVTLRWADRDDNNDPNYSAELGHTDSHVGQFVPGPIRTIWYTFNRTAAVFIFLDQAKGISNFWFEILYFYDRSGRHMSQRPKCPLFTASVTAHKGFIHCVIGF